MARRILIVEPDPRTSQDLFALFHSQRGSSLQDRYELQVATSLSEAAEIAQTIRFHCVILDVNLPEMKGYEAVPLVRTINSDPPVIVITAENSPELEAKVREQDVFFYHLTSFDYDELRLAVESMFEKLPTLKEGKKPGAVRPILLKPLRSFGT
jgi:DNA-binding response OmpR family regulator